MEGLYLRDYGKHLRVGWWGLPTRINYVIGTMCLFMFTIGFLAYSLSMSHSISQKAHTATATTPIRLENVPRPFLSVGDYPGFSRVIEIQTLNFSPEKAAQAVLVLTLLKDDKSWGNKRSFLSHFALVESLMSPAVRNDSLSIGLLISSSVEYYKVLCWVLIALNLEQHVDVLPQKGIQCQDWQSSFPFQPDSPEGTYIVQGLQQFQRIVLIHQKEFENSEISRQNRHMESLQKERRRLIARYRNMLQSLALKTERAVLWVDADIVQIPYDLVGKMLDSGLDVVVPTCNWLDAGYYDYNTWKGPRAKPNEEQRKDIAEGKLFVPHSTEDTKFLFHFAGNADEFVEMDSVGGTVLFIRSPLLREGVHFPVFPIIGSEWEYEGYDGIETEGLCYVAKQIGYKCWGMPKAIVEHDSS